MRVGYASRWMTEWLQLQATYFPRSMHVYGVYYRAGGGPRSLGYICMYIHTACCERWKGQVACLETNAGPSALSSAAEESVAVGPQERRQATTRSRGCGPRLS